MILPDMHSWMCLNGKEGPTVSCESDAILYSVLGWFYFALFNSLLSS